MTNSSLKPKNKPKIKIETTPRSNNIYDCETERLRVRNKSLKKIIAE